MTRDIFVISDTHFGHSNIIKYCDRPFHSADEMDEVMVDNWNSVVKDGDIVYHLGDVYFDKNSRDGYWNTLFARLKGRKRLLLGNHDNGKDKRLQAVFQKIELWRMFTEYGLLLTHVPVHETSLKRTDGSSLLNIHGHIHQNESPTKHHRNVSVEKIDYTPINIEELRIK